MLIAKRISILKKIAVESAVQSPPSTPPESSSLEQNYPYIAQEAWLTEALRRSFRSEDHDIFQFINENYDSISELRRSFQQTPRLIGAGKDGVAFDIGGDKVLKIFSNQFSYEKAMQAVNLLHSKKEMARTEAMIYDVGALGYLPSTEKPVFYSLTEKMAPVSENPMASLFLKKLLKLAKNAILNDNIKRELDALRGKREKSHKKVKLIADMLKLAIIEDVGVGQLENIREAVREEMGLRPDWLEKYLEEIILKIITHRFDLHIGNVGATSTGWMRYFDSAYIGDSGYGDEDSSDKALSKLVDLKQVALDSEET